MNERAWVSPAVRAAASTASLDKNAIDVLEFVRGLLGIRSNSAIRLITRMGLPLDDVDAWLESFRPNRWMVTWDDLAELHGFLARRHGPPATTAGILGALLATAGNGLGGFGDAFRREFGLQFVDLLQSIRVVRGVASAELNSVVAPIVRAVSPSSRTRGVKDLVLPYSVGLEVILERARSRARRKREPTISSAALMTALHSQTMTADWARCLLAIGLNPRVLGADAALAEHEAGMCTVQLFGVPAPRTYAISDQVADVLVLALEIRLSGSPEDVASITTHDLLLAQLAIGSSRLGAKVWDLLDEWLSPIELYARFVNCAGVSSSQLGVAEARYRAARKAPSGPLGDYTDELVSSALSARPVSDGGDEQRTLNLFKVLHPDHHTLIERHDALARDRDETRKADAPAGFNAAALFPIGSGTDVDGVAKSRDAVSQLVEAKRHLIIRQPSSKPDAVQYAADAGMSLAKLATQCGAAAAWRDAAECAVMLARIPAASALLQYRRRPIRRPAVAFSAEDVDTCDAEFVSVVIDSDGGVLTHRRVDGTWTGAARPADAGERLSGWERRWRRALKTGHVERSLAELLQLIQLDAEDLSGPTVHLIASGSARGFPIAQAITVATRGRVSVLTHTLGGLPPASSVEGLHFSSSVDVCLIEEPPVPGRPLRFAAVETSVLAAVTSPSARLADDRASRSWVQRAVTAIPGVPGPAVLHFTGHGTIRTLPNGQTAAAIVLSDGELFTPGDIAMVEAGVRTLVCAACDIAGATMQGGHNLADDALRAGIELVIAAAWPVDDAVAACLVARAYWEWTRDWIDLAAAFHRASQWWLDSSPASILDFVAGLPSTDELWDYLESKFRSVGPKWGRGGQFWGAFAAYVP